MKIDELKKKIKSIMLTRDTKLLGKAIDNWAWKNKVAKVDFVDLNKADVYGYYSDYNSLDGSILDRLTFRLKWFDHELEIVFRGHGGNYIIVSLDNVRAYEVGPKDIWNDKPDLLMKAYCIYEELFNAILETFSSYLDEEDHSVEAISVALTKKEKSFVERFARLQHPEAKDNVGTIFPTIHIVRDVEYYEAPEGYGDGFFYNINNDGEYNTYGKFSNFKEAVTEYLEEYIMSNFVPNDKEVVDAVEEIFEAIKSDCFHGFDNMAEDIQELLNINCYGDIEEVLNAYSEAYDEFICSEYSFDFEDLNEKIEEITGDDCYKISKFYYHEVKKPVAFFLIREEAVKYLNYQSHNLRNPDIFTYSIGYANNGDMRSLANILLKIGEGLISKD